MSTSVKTRPQGSTYTRVAKTLLAELSPKRSATLLIVAQTLSPRRQVRQAKAPLRGLFTKAQRDARSSAAATQEADKAAEVFGYRETETKRAAKALRLKVQIEYVHKAGPHHRDDADTRARKTRLAAEIRDMERTFEVRTRMPVAEWNADEMVRVITSIQRQMPREAPAASPFGGRAPDYDGSAIHPDAFTDGRRLTNIMIDGHHDGRGIIYFCTAAGYSVRIHTEGHPPAAALVHLVGQADRPARVSIWLDRRAVAKVARARARLAERDAAKVAAKPLTSTRIGSAQ